MRAIALTEYGEPDVLTTHSLPEPLVCYDQVLIDVHGAGVNPVDTKIRQGFLQQLIPNNIPLIPGWEVAGIVAKVGTAVTQFRAGDKVYGYIRKDHIQDGAYAEQVAADELVLAHAPSSLDLVHAAALPLAGLTALQALQAAQVSQDDVVLIHAAAGGVGHLAIQLARILGARVIGTASERNHEYLRALGAEPLRYGPELPNELKTLIGPATKVDAVLDLVGGEALEQSPGLVSTPGRLVSIVDGTRVRELGGIHVFVRHGAEQLSWLGELIDKGELKLEVQHVFPLEEAAQAHRVLEEGHTRGKIVLKVR